MIPKECKRLAEVDFPIAVVSKHSAREKSIRHGHPSTLHLWWARRPLAACRAMLLGLLLPDPCDPHCPEDFKEKARDLLPKVQGKVGPDDKDLRQALLKFIGDFSNWDLSTDQTYLEVSRGLVKAAHTDETPLVVDPFAGGGSIPLEALRLGCETFASDLNPVACLILKVMLEDIPRHGPKLAEDLRRVGQEIKEKAEKELAEFYPKDPDGATPIAYLWARTIRCEWPNCGAEIPLLRSFWLSKKVSRRRALRPIIAWRSGSERAPNVTLEIFEPQNEGQVQQGTVSKVKATCLACNRTMSADRVRTQLAAERGGANVRLDGAGRRVGGARLIAVVTESVGGKRDYREASADDYIAVQRARRKLAELLDQEGHFASEFLPGPEGRAGETADAYFNFLPAQIYGLETWGDLFTERQKVALVLLINSIRRLGSSMTRFSLGTILGRCVDYWSAGAIWAQEGEFVAHTFGRHALPMILDFAETNPIGAASGSLDSAIDWVLRVVNAGVTPTMVGQVNAADARACPLPDEVASVWFTDPPYYDAVPYSYLSNFFLVWLKRLLAEEFAQEQFGKLESGLAPSSLEIIDTLDLLRGADKKSAISRGLRLKDKSYFENAMREAFSEGNRVLGSAGVCCVVFAHKTTEGWEALLSGMIQSGWTVSASWPLATERPGRLRSQNSAALATSIHLVCRPRSEDATVGDWGDVLRELPNRVGEWMERLQLEDIRGADLVFACVGPALEIFSRYLRVETAEGREVGLPEFLGKVWEVVGRTALEQILGTAEAKARNSAAGALEEDARLTALFLWTLQSTNGNEADVAQDKSGANDAEDEIDEAEPQKKKKAGLSLIFDVVRRFAQPLGIHLPDWEGRIIETQKGVVRLLPVSERAKQLFGKEGAQAVATAIERSYEVASQLKLFPDFVDRESSMVKIRGRGRRGSRHIAISDEDLTSRREATTLDRIHAAMLLQKSGRTNALRTMLKAEQDRSPDFLRLANALSALYPRSSEEKRLLDAMLLAMPR
jgi:putative DNA methylase